MKRAAAGLLVAAASWAAHAGRPLTIDDASVLPDKACQLEAWTDRSREATQSWIAPACNFGGGIEWQAGFARSREMQRWFFSEAYVQAKAVLLPLDPSKWGYGLVLGVSRFPAQATHRRYENPYLIVPFSATIGEATLHLNAGWSRDRMAHRDETFWGAAVETPLTPRVTAVAEAFGKNRAKPFLRAGGRFAVIPDRLDLDLTVVTRPGGTRAERYVSLGMYWQGTPFLP
ncbi:MAG: hypothetical protein H7Y14_00395 [Burkholderiales bacterium]|nr:hypothetical protein [Burkholderiales bacterium]